MAYNRTEKKMIPLTIRIKRKIIRTFFREQWSILLCDRGGKILCPIVPPQDYQWADPFPVEYNGKIYIFLEQQIRNNNGTLGIIEWYPDKTFSAFIPILEKEYHLSFPNVFNIEHNGQTIWYMIPETHENKTIDLYRAIEFPYTWNYETTLMRDVSAVDSTLLYHHSKWWLFTSLGSENKSVNTDLSIFYSEQFPSDKWIPHPQNPIYSSLSNSRMAGAVFLNNQGFYRPAQNCIKDYGKETNINEIIELNTDSYKEKTIRTIFPEPHLHAVCTHTINYSPTYMLRDIKTRRFRFLLHRSSSAFI